MGERPRRLDAFERVVDRRGFGTADVDRQETVAAVLLAQQHHRCVRRASRPGRRPVQEGPRSHRTRPSVVHRDVSSPEPQLEGVLRSVERIIADAEPTAGLVELGQLRDAWARACGIALAQQRLDHLLEQPRLAVGGDLPAAEVPRLETRIEESLGDRRDLDGVLAVQAAGRRAMRRRRRRTTRGWRGLRR